MPIRKTDFFADPTEGLNRAVNPFVDKMIQGAQDGSLPCLYGPMLKPNQYRWSESFEERTGTAMNGIVLEIGMHKGETLVQLATERSDIGFIGLDITFKRVVTTAEKVAEQDLKNVLSCLANAKDLQELFAPNSLEGVVVFFPDPWNKKRGQTKNRLLQPQFIQKLFDLVKPNGFFWFKTDCFAYAQAVTEANQSIGWLATEKTFPIIFSKDHGSCFERKFHEIGQETVNQVWVKPPVVSASFNMSQDLIN